MFSNVQKYFYANDNENLNVRQIFKPIYIVLTFFGLFPYSIKFNNNKRGLTIIKKSIYINSLCSVSYILLLFTFCGLHMRYVVDSIGDTVMTREVLTQMNYNVEMASFLIFCVTAYFCAFKNRNIYVKIINKIANNTDTSNIESNLKKLRFQTNMIIVYLVLVSLLQVAVNWTRDDSLWKALLVHMTFLVPQLIQFTVLAFYYVLILMLVVLLKNIRLHIANLSMAKTIVMDHYVKSEDKVLTLQYVESLYEIAFEIKRDINNVFQMPFLFTTVQCFHTMVSESHIIYHGLVVEKDFSRHNIVNCSIWVIYQIFKLYIMSRSGHLLKHEVSKIGQALHSIPTAKHDIRLLLEIQHFSSLILFHGDDITAYGLFSLDAALLSKIVASSAMYLTIVVQFDRK
ncbi:uncharacterized protein LOC111347973 [Spodoptera litura]|uniref:Gustatory receptor n=1 Tax=Spodoptera litura TaxID=69820 RepID=A0A9J7DP83_SPOLT